MENFENNFDLSILTPKQMQTMKLIEEEMNSLLKVENSSDFIRFWENNERIPGDYTEECEPLYSCGITTEYKKKIKKLVQKTVMAKNFVFTQDLNLNRIYMGLPLEIQSKIIVWSKCGYKILSKYFERFDYVLRAVRFDFIPEDENHFVIPYLPMANIFLSKKPNSNIISLNDYIAETTEIIEKVAEIQKQIKSAEK